MRFGLMYLLQNPRPWNADSEARIYREALEQIQLADELGFDYAWASEHHFLDEYSMSSAPEVFLAAAAALTKRIRVAHGIVSLPSGVNHPARVAERIGALDIISGGRLDFGTGQGSTQHELGAFNTDRATKREQWAESIEVILRMFTEEPFTGYQGRWGSMPPRNVLPKPIQKPYPPVWIACSFPDTIEAAARRGLGALSFAFSKVEECIERAETYYRTLESDDCVPIGPQVNANFAVAFPFFCHQDQEVAYERAMGGIEFYIQSFMHYYIQGSHRPGLTDLRRDFSQEPLPPESLARMTDVARQAVGTPEKLRELVRIHEDAGVDQIIFQVQLGDNKHEHICESMKLFAETVMPEFAERREAVDRAKAERLRGPIEKALSRRADTAPVDVSNYVIRTDFEEGAFGDRLDEGAWDADKLDLD